MLRLRSGTGWWLITHPDHARLAGSFARRWGNATFKPPTPRLHVLHAIDVHDDGWALRDAQPSITREGLPAAFSHELVGKYSAFEEIDLADYLTVRERAVERVEMHNLYAALLVSMHTYNLLTARADRSTIRPLELPLLDAFLERQMHRQERLRRSMEASDQLPEVESGLHSLEDNFRLLQATDNLSLLSCVAFRGPATLLHPLRTHSGETQTVSVENRGERQFRLRPYPFDEQKISFDLPARHILGTVFRSHEELRDLYARAPVEHLSVVVSA